eukprot:TRINITY_DN4908_c0_g1_i1.p1 TRINITY_DN4908_c0_g1~~TRINITY_DN4908_c0_g1_i1.p1  ORF type:complete len:1300 (+),score=396.68 TRINITY_DN4908_c0_g1_i1:55-3900(+)
MAGSFLGKFRAFEDDGPATPTSPRTPRGDRLPAKRQKPAALMALASRPPERQPRGSGDWLEAALMSETPLAMDDDGDMAVDQDVLQGLGGLGDTRGGLPPQEQMRDMPAALRAEMQSMAKRQLQRLLIPRMLLWLSRARGKRFRVLRQQAQPVAEQAKDGNVALRGAKVLKRSELLELFPDDALLRLCSQGSQKSCHPGEVVVHEGENFGSGMYALLEGVVQVVKKTSQVESPPGSPGHRRRKSVAADGPGNIVCARLEAPQLLGDFTLLTEEPRTASIVSLTDTDWTIIPKACFMRELAALAEEPRRRVYALAFARRVQNMIRLFPMSISDLRRSFLFDSLSDTQCRALIARLQPRCYRKGQYLARPSGRATEMFFLRRGELELVHKGHSSGDSVVLLSEGSSFGELALFFRERHAAAIRARANCDVWVLFAEDLQVLLSDKTMYEKLRMTAHTQRLRWLQENAAPGTVQWRELRKAVAQTPILRDVCSQACLEAVADVLAPRVYVAADVILSQSDGCDRLVVLTRGRALLQRHGTKAGRYGHLEPYEVVGFTCLTEHRWAAAVCAANNCDTWEVPVARLREVLRRHGCLREVQKQARALLTTPDALPDPPQLTPALWPTAEESEAGTFPTRWFVGKHRLQRAEPLSPSPSPPPHAQPAASSGLSPQATGRAPQQADRASVSAALEMMGGESTRAQMLMGKLQRLGSLAGKVGRLYRSSSAARPSRDESQRLAERMERLLNRSSERLVKVDRRRVRKRCTVLCHNGELPRSRHVRMAPVRGRGPRCLRRHEAKMRSFSNITIDPALLPRPVLWHEEPKPSCPDTNDTDDMFSALEEQRSFRSILRSPSASRMSPRPARLASFVFGNRQEGSDSPNAGEGRRVSQTSAPSALLQRRASGNRRASWADVLEPQDATSADSRRGSLDRASSFPRSPRSPRAPLHLADDGGDSPLLDAAPEPQLQRLTIAAPDSPPASPPEEVVVAPMRRRLCRSVRAERALRDGFRSGASPDPRLEASALSNTSAAASVSLVTDPIAPRPGQSRQGGLPGERQRSQQEPQQRPEPQLEPSQVCPRQERSIRVTLRTNLPPPGSAGPLTVSVHCWALPQLRSQLLRAAAAPEQQDWPVTDLRLYDRRGLVAVTSVDAVPPMAEMVLLVRRPGSVRRAAGAGARPAADAGVSKRARVLLQRCATAAAAVEAAEAADNGRGFATGRRTLTSRPAPAVRLLRRVVSEEAAAAELCERLARAAPDGIVSPVRQLAMQHAPSAAPPFDPCPAASPALRL